MQGWQGQQAGRTWGVGDASGGVSKDTWNVVVRTFRPALELPAADRGLAGKGESCLSVPCTEGVEVGPGLSHVAGFPLRITGYSEFALPELAVALGLAEGVVP